MNQTKLTPAEISVWADKYQAANVHMFSDEAKAAGLYLDYYDGCAVSTELHQRDVTRAIEAFDTTPAIKAYMLSQVSSRGARAPEKRDVSFFSKCAQSTTNQWHKARKPYAPKGECSLKLCLKEGVSFGYRQEAYADHSETIIPVKGDVSKADLKVCQQNLSEFVRYADTHTGLAGSGCNYSISLHVTEQGAFAVVDCRSSISD